MFSIFLGKDGVKHILLKKIFSWRYKVAIFFDLRFVDEVSLAYA